MFQADAMCVYVCVCMSNLCLHRLRGSFVASGHYLLTMKHGSECTRSIDIRDD